MIEYMVRNFVRSIVSIVVCCFVFCIAGTRMAQGADPGTVGGVIVFGASRGVGLEVVKLLRAKGEPVTVFVRPNSERAELEKLNVTFATGDVLQPETLAAAFKAQAYRAAISTVGGAFMSDYRPDSEGNINVINAAATAGVRRVLLVTSIGSGTSKEAIPAAVRLVLGSGLQAKSKAEEVLKASNLDWTILRPGNLGDGPATQKATLVNDPLAFKAGAVPRADVARLLLQTIDDPASFKKDYNIIP